MKFMNADLSKAVNQIHPAVKKDARYGELGVIKNPDGSVSTEYSMTENVPELGGWVNLPTLVEGQEGYEEFLKGKKLTKKQRQLAIQRAIERVKQGAELPSYKTMEDALAVARSRTEEEKNVPYAGMDFLSRDMEE